jgi:hypothetical protein
MKLTKRQLQIAQQAVGYAVMYAQTESETAEFALLKLDIDSALIRIDAGLLEPEPTKNLNAVPYQTCPLCLGAGRMTGYSSSIFQTCHVCNGARIIPMHVVPPAESSKRD